MRNLNTYLITTFFGLLFLTGCSFFTEYKVKNIAIETTMNNYEEIYKAEMQSSLGSYHHRGQDYVSYSLRHTVVTVVSLTQTEPDYYQIELSVKSLTSEVRNTFLEQLKPIRDERESNNFNFGDSVSAYQKLHPNSEVEPERKFIMSVKKIDGEWKAK